MCTSYEANPNDAWDVFSLFAQPDFDYKGEIYASFEVGNVRRQGRARARRSAPLTRVA